MWTVPTWITSFSCRSRTWPGWTRVRFTNVPFRLFRSSIVSLPFSNVMTACCRERPDAVRRLLVLQVDVHRLVVRPAQVVLARVERVLHVHPLPADDDQLRVDRDRRRRTGSGGGAGRRSAWPAASGRRCPRRGPALDGRLPQADRLQLDRRRVHGRRARTRPAARRRPPAPGRSAPAGSAPRPAGSCRSSRLDRSWQSAPVRVGRRPASPGRPCTSHRIARRLRSRSRKRGRSSAVTSAR